MDEARPAGRQRDRHPGTDHPTLPRCQLTVLCDGQIRTRITGVGVLWQGKVGLKADDVDQHVAELEWGHRRSLTRGPDPFGCVAMTIATAPAMPAMA